REPLPHDERDKGGREREPARVGGDEREPDGVAGKAGPDRRDLAEPGDHGMDEAALNEHEPDADQEEHAVGRALRQVEAGLGQQRERGFEAAERDERHERDEHQPPQPGSARPFPRHRRRRSDAVDLRMQRAGLREPADGGDGVHRGDRGSDEERKAVAHERGDATDGRPEREPGPERGAEQPEQPGPLLLGGDVGDGGLRHRHARAARAVQDPAAEQQPQRPGEAGQQAADGGADERQNDHRLAPQPVRQAPGQGRAHQLRDRERGDDEPGRRRRRARVTGVAREDGEQDAEADQVEGDRRPDDPEPRRQRPARSPRPRTAHDGQPMPPDARPSSPPLTGREPAAGWRMQAADTTPPPQQPQQGGRMGTTAPHRTDQTEAQIVARAQHGDEAAFRELYRRHGHPAWRVALAVGASAAVAEHAVTKGFTGALRRLRKGTTSLVVPFRLQAVRASLEVAATAARHDDAPVDPPVNEHVAAFGELPERWRAAIWLTAVEGGTPAQVAPILGLTEEATANLTARATAGFRERYLRDGPERVFDDIRDA